MSPNLLNVADIFLLVKGIGNILHSVVKPIHCTHDREHLIASLTDKAACLITVSTYTLQETLVTSMQ
jgi:hypothetical protein